MLIMNQNLDLDASDFKVPSMSALGFGDLGWTGVRVPKFSRGSKFVKRSQPQH